MNRHYYLWLNAPFPILTFSDNACYAVLLVSRKRKSGLNPYICRQVRLSSSSSSSLASVFIFRIFDDIYVNNRRPLHSSLVKKYHNKDLSVIFFANWVSFHLQWFARNAIKLFHFFMLEFANQPLPSLFDCLLAYLMACNVRAEL